MAVATQASSMVLWGGASWPVRLCSYHNDCIPGSRLDSVVASVPSMVRVETTEMTRAQTFQSRPRALVLVIYYMASPVIE